MTSHRNAEACGCDYGLTPPYLCAQHRAMSAAVPEPHAWIGVDLDGTLAIYPHSFPAIGPPIPAMVERVKGWLAEGKDVRIFTARVCPNPDDAFREDQISLINLWTAEHIGVVLLVTATKDYEMIELWDDRCVQLVINTGRRVDEIDPEALIEQRVIGRGDGQRDALADVLALPRVRVAVPDGGVVTMADVIKVADIEALVPR